MFLIYLFKVSLVHLFAIFTCVLPFLILLKNGIVHVYWKITLQLFYVARKKRKAFIFKEKS